MCINCKGNYNQILQQQNSIYKITRFFEANLIVGDDAIVHDQELITGARRLRVTVSGGGHTVCSPPGVGNSSMHIECGIQVHLILINLWKEQKMEQVLASVV
jgi:hypothetical protein